MSGLNEIIINALKLTLPTKSDTKKSFESQPTEGDYIEERNFCQTG